MDSELEKILEDNFKSASSSDGALPSGTVLNNRYKIVKLVKAGGMGAVYEAEDTKFNSICAVKELFPAYGSPDEQKETVEWFEREAKLLAGLDHPGLPKVFDYFVIESVYYLVMDFIQGEDIFSILVRDGSPGLPQEKVIEWSKDVLKVLDYLHSQTPPVLYRDMKPGNIMVGEEGKVYLIDFGIAKVIRDQKTQTVIGTEGYASLEQCRGKAEPRSDIYSLGATMHHLLSGQSPVPFRFENLSVLVPKISRPLSRVVMKALEREAKDRYSSAKEMLSALNIKIAKKSEKINIPLKPTGSGKWKAQYTDCDASLRSVHFIDENTGWAAGYGALFNGVLLQTVNGGKTWSIKKKGGFSGVHFISHEEGFLVGGGLLGGVILHTKDCGRTWKKRKPSFIIPVLNNIFFENPSLGWVIGDNGFIARTIDRGVTWEKQKSNTVEDLYGINFLNSDEGCITGRNGLILNTADSGETWERHNSNTKVSLRDISLSDGRKICSVGDMGTILHSKAMFFEEILGLRKSKKWKKYEKRIFLSSEGVRYNSPDLYSVHFIDSENGWIVGQKGVLLYTNDCGDTWVKVDNLSSENLYDVYFTDSRNGWAVGDKGTIFKYSE